MAWRISCPLYSLTNKIPIPSPSLLTSFSNNGRNPASPLTIWLRRPRSCPLHLSQFLDGRSGRPRSQEVPSLLSLSLSLSILIFGLYLSVSILYFRYKVFYPNLYALESDNKDAKLFNCVQVSIIHVFPLVSFRYYHFESEMPSLIGTERAPEFARNDAFVLHAYDFGRNWASLPYRFLWSSLCCVSILLLQRLRYRCA